MPEEIRPYTGTGRFATTVDAYVYELAQEGLNDEFSAKDSSWFGLLKSDGRAALYDPSLKTQTTLNEAEQRFLLSKAGVIIETTGEGVTTMDYFDLSDELNEAWKNLYDTRVDIGEEHEFEDVDAQPEIPDAAPPPQITDDMLRLAETQGYDDARNGARPGSVPSIARYDAWTTAWGVHLETHPNEMGYLTDAWKRGVYTFAAEQGNRTAAVHIRKVSGSTDIALTLDKVVKTLANGGIPSLVVGGYAVQEHGYARFTHDVDVVVPDVASAREFLSIRGFRPNNGSSMTLTDRDTKVEVDLLPGGGHVGPGPVGFPTPTEVSFTPTIVDLPTILSLKLSSYVGNKLSRIQDMADVVKLLEANHPPRNLNVAPQVKDLYEETWDQLFPPS